LPKKIGHLHTTFLTLLNLVTWLYNGVLLPTNKWGNFIGKITASLRASFAPSNPDHPILHLVSLEELLHILKDYIPWIQKQTRNCYTHETIYMISYKIIFIFFVFLVSLSTIFIFTFISFPPFLFPLSFAAIGFFFFSKCSLISQPALNNP